MESTEFTFKIGGEAGFGIASAGLIFAKTYNRLNYYTYGYLEYPSLIRGGHNVYEVHVGVDPVYSQESRVDILVCLNRETFDLHKSELKSGSVVIFDPNKTKIADDEKKDFLIYPVPVSQMVKDLGGKPIMENIVFLGLVLALLQADPSAIHSVLEDIFKDKGTEIIDGNKKMIQAGYDFVAANIIPTFSITTPKLSEKNNLVMTGNEAISLGAIASDCRIYATYPMTPASSILHVLAQYSESSKMVFRHVWDEIEAINLVVGSAFTGVRSMTGTSGGGFALMNEGLGLAGVTESAIVLCVSQRPGPATGVPTWTGQGDFQFVMHAAQDEFPRIILSPGDSEESYTLTQKAFNLADMYQTPVFVLTDKYLSEGLMTVNQDDLKKLGIKRGKLAQESDLQPGFQRYQSSKDGISLRSVAGQKNGAFLANSYEHDGYGFATEEAEMIKMQRDKRAEKLRTYLYVDRQFEAPKVYGKEIAEVTIISWGSTKMAVLEAMKNLDERVNFYHFTHIYPIDKQLIKAMLDKTNKTLLLEGNGSGQFAMFLREQTGWQPTEQYLRYDGRPFYPEDIRERVKKLL